MQRAKNFWNAFKNFAIIFSFIVNFTLILVILFLLVLIWQIKTGIAEPLIDGLHTSFVGLDKATIDRVIPVRDELDIAFTLPLQQSTTVVLTEAVPLQVNALIDLPGINAYNVNAAVNLQLPAGLRLPVALDLEVPVNQTIPVSLDVRAIIPIEETQLHDPIENLRRTLQPFVNALDRLPNNEEEGREFLGELANGVLGRGPMPDVLTPTERGLEAWPGYSITAGEGYVWPEDTPSQPGQSTGIVPGGLGRWTLPEGASDGIYIPFGQTGPAGIIPSGSPFLGGGPAQFTAGQQEGSSSPPSTDGSGDMGIVTPPPSDGQAQQATPVPPGADLGIITVTPAQQ